jgi:hypothetical protein
MFLILHSRVNDTYLLFLLLFDSFCSSAMNSGRRLGTVVTDDTVMTSWPDRAFLSFSSSSSSSQADAAGEAIEDLVVGFDDAGTARRRSFDIVESVFRKDVDVQRLFNHVCTLSPRRTDDPSYPQDAEDAQSPSNPE